LQRDRATQAVTHHVGRFDVEYLHEPCGVVGELRVAERSVNVWSSSGGPSPLVLKTWASLHPNPDPGIVALLYK
jgi:hypothetical protein